MCLAVPGKLIEWLQHDSPFAQAWVEFAGVRRKVNMACLPQASIGDYVLVHAGIAISGIDEEEAHRVQQWLAELGEAPESGSHNLPRPSPLTKHERGLPDETC